MTRTGQTRYPYLSDDWFAVAREQTTAVLIGRIGLTARLQFEASSAAGPIRWAQVIADGQVVEWRLGDLDEPDVELRLDLAHAWRLAQQDTDGTAALAGVEVFEEGLLGKGIPPSPMDLGERPELDDLPVVPGATLDVQYEYSAGPWGNVSFSLSFVDGKVDAMSLGRIAEPDVVAKCSYLQMAQVRRGDIGILDVLADGGTVQGPEGALALLGGISESREFRRAEMACGRSGTTLGALGELHRAPGYVGCLEGLLAATDPPVELGGASG